MYYSQAEDSVEALSKRLEVTARQKADSEDMVKRLSAENTYVSLKMKHFVHVMWIGIVYQFNHSSALLTDCIGPLSQNMPSLFW